MAYGDALENQRRTRPLFQRPRARPIAAQQATDTDAALRQTRAIQAGINYFPAWNPSYVGTSGRLGQDRDLLGMPREAGYPSPGGQVQQGIGPSTFGMNPYPWQPNVGAPPLRQAEPLPANMAWQQMNEFGTRGGTAMPADRIVGPGTMSGAEYVDNVRRGIAAEQAGGTGYHKTWYGGTGDYEAPKLTEEQAGNRQRWADTLASRKLAVQMRAAGQPINPLQSQFAVGAAQGRWNPAQAFAAGMGALPVAQWNAQNQWAAARAPVDAAQIQAPAQMASAQAQWAPYYQSQVEAPARMAAAQAPVQAAQIQAPAQMAAAQAAWAPAYAEQMQYSPQAMEMARQKQQAELERQRITSAGMLGVGMAASPNAWTPPTPGGKSPGMEVLGQIQGPQAAQGANPGIPQAPQPVMVGKTAYPPEVFQQTFSGTTPQQQATIMGLAADPEKLASYLQAIGLPIQHQRAILEGATGSPYSSPVNPTGGFWGRPKTWWYGQTPGNNAPGMWGR